MTTFADLGLSQPVLQALDLKGYNTPTPIQEQAIPAVLKGRDLLGIAQTGTGKTAAFMLPSIDRLREADKQIPFKSCRMLVLAPTRELAVQIADSAKDYGALAGLKVQCIVGGTSVGKDRNKLHRGTDILVATPGRLLDLIDQRALTLRNVEIFVLDEADQMMDLGFIHALKRVANLLPKTRQSLFFSATMPKAIEDLGKQFIVNPVRVEVAPNSTTAERVEQYVTFVNQAEKQALLTLRIEAPDLQVSVDDEKLAVIADNLLSNAIKFTARGKVQLDITAGAPGTEGSAVSASDEPVTEAAGLALPAASNALRAPWYTGSSMKMRSPASSSTVAHRVKACWELVTTSTRSGVACAPRSRLT